MPAKVVPGPAAPSFWPASEMPPHVSLVAACSSACAATASYNAAPNAPARAGAVRVRV